MAKRNILITGGAGFIGNHVVRLFVNKYPDYRIVNLDKLTYAGNLANLKDVENAPNYTFVKADICDYEKMLEIFEQYDIDGVFLTVRLVRELGALNADTLANALCNDVFRFHINELIFEGRTSRVDNKNFHCFPP